MEEIVLIGFGGHAKSIIDTIEANEKYKIAGILEKRKEDGKIYRGYHIIGTDDDMEDLYRDGIKNAFVAIGYVGLSHIRNHIYKRLKRICYTLPTIIDPSAVVARDAVIGEGSFIGKRAVINSDAFVGKMCIINTGAVLEHECMVGDFSHISVGTILCGQVHVEDNSFIGAGSTVIQEIHIGRYSIIGAGSKVIKNVEEYTMVYDKAERIVRREDFR